jgi:hypothetical protein
MNHEVLCEANPAGTITGLLHTVFGVGGPIQILVHHDYLDNMYVLSERGCTCAAMLVYGLPLAVALTGLHNSSVDNRSFNL